MTDKNVHFFANHALGWATGSTREEAIEKLLLSHLTDSKWVNNCLKSGEPLTVFSCQVNAPIDAPYRIEWYVPKGVEWQDGANCIVTYLTKKAYATMPDPRDEVHRLEAQLAKLEDAIREHKSYHAPEVREALGEAESMDEFGNFLDAEDTVDDLDRRM